MQVPLGTLQVALPVMTITKAKNGMVRILKCILGQRNKDRGCNVTDIQVALSELSSLDDRSQ